MKRLFNFPGGRPAGNSDLEAIQIQLDAMMSLWGGIINPSQAGPFVVTGCQVSILSASPLIYNINPGVICINGIFIRIATPIQANANTILCWNSFQQSSLRPYALAANNQNALQEPLLQVRAASSPLSGENLYVDGAGMRTFREAVQSFTYQPGQVIHYTGSLSDFDGTGKGSAMWRGWQLCNGQNGSHDLRDRFLVGQGNTYSTGATGGANEVTLTAAQSGVPAHTHPRNYFNSVNVTPGSGATVTNMGAETEQVTANTPENAAAAHENRPPYYALAYIQYVGVPYLKV